jgi:hypothetical protein
MSFGSGCPYDDHCNSQQQEKNSFGPPPNYLMPDSWNMSTSMSVMKSGRDDPKFKKMAQAAQSVEMDLR